MSSLFPEDITALLPLIVLAVLGLVQFVKSFGVEGRILTGVSFVIGAIYGVGIFVLPVDTVKIVIAVSLFGLAASGLYDFGSLIGSAFRKPAA